MLCSSGPIISPGPQPVEEHDFCVPAAPSIHWPWKLPRGSANRIWMTGVWCYNSALTSEAEIMAATMIRKGTLSVIGCPYRVGRIRLQCGRAGFDPWVGKIPGRRERLSTLVIWPGEFHGLYSPWGCKERKDTVLSPFKWKLTSRNAPLFPNLFCGVCMGVQEQGVVSRSEIEEGRPKVRCNQNGTPLNKL